MNLKKMLYIDRRIIYLLVAAGALVPIIRPIGLPVMPTKPVAALYDAVEKLGPENAVIVSFDYGPSSEPELNPMAEAIFRHLFARKIKVVVMAMFPLGGNEEAKSELNKVAAEYDLQYGVDYVNLGYKEGGQAVMKRMAVSIPDLFPADTEGKPTAGMPIMAQVKNYTNVSLLISLATGVIGEWWANLVNPQFGVPVSVGCTAVSAPKYYAYLRAGQMMSLLGGLKGASEYEKLVKAGYPLIRQVYEKPEVKKVAATTGMDVQSIVHVVIIAFIVFGNVIYFATRKEGSK
ncbi:MAG TPA: hypothetical protein VMU02_08590 [bacterium]|nr:hypothetical protein [bacterium]